MIARCITKKHSRSRDYRHSAVDPGLALAQPVRQPARAVFQPNGGAADDLRGDPADASGRRGVNVASGESDCPAVDANENPTFFIA